MPRLIDQHPGRERFSGGDAVRRAWYVLLLLPVSFFAAFALAQVLYTGVGHDPASETPPHWADAVALVPAGVVFIIPALLAVVFARQAVRAGHRAGYLPAAAAVVVVTVYAVANVL